MSTPLFFYFYRLLLAPADWSQEIHEDIEDGVHLTINVDAMLEKKKLGRGTDSFCEQSPFVGYLLFGVYVFLYTLYHM